MFRSPILPLMLGLASSVAYGQLSARIVKYHANDIVNVRAKMRYTTLIQLPLAEKIREVATGDKDFWVIDAVGNLCFLHPAKEGIHSNLTLITEKGNVYSFLLDDEESGEPDLKVVIELSDATELAAVRSATTPPDDQTLPSVEHAAESRAEAAIEQFRSQYPIEELQFDYLYRTRQPFDLTAIFHDRKFTYIRTKSTEKFAIYEELDKKPSLVSFELRSNTYIVPKVIEKGYVQLGKSRLAFVRKGE